jgi:anti-sigma factor ChrR (cupin superfamily)
MPDIASLPAGMQVLAAILDDPARRAALDWEFFRPGVEAAWLYRTEDGGPAAAFLRYQPGADVPRHRHIGYEHILVLEGAQQDEFGHYPAGTLVVNAPGSEHKVRSREGCIALLIWERAVEMLEA